MFRKDRSRCGDGGGAVCEAGRRSGVKEAQHLILKAVHHDLQTRPQLHVDAIKTPGVPFIFASLVYFQGLRKAVLQFQIDDLN